jgi:hypothetical protein
MEGVLLFLRRCWLRSRRNSLVIAMSLLAVAVILTPVQRYLAIARYQHYGIAMCIFAFGYLLQTCAGWRGLRKWAKISYITTGLFFFAVGAIFVSNAWLDGRVSPRTEAHESLRMAIQCFYLLAGLVVTCVWLRLVYDDMQPVSEQELKKTRTPK